MLCDNLFELSSFTPRRGDLAGIGLSDDIAGQALVASLQKILGPFVIQVLGDAFSPRKPSKTMPIFSSALYCLRVLRLMSFMWALTTIAVLPSSSRRHSHDAPCIARLPSLSDRKPPTWAACGFTGEWSGFMKPNAHDSNAGAFSQKGLGDTAANSGRDDGNGSDFIFELHNFRSP